MPARYQIPDYEERAKLIAAAGIYTAREYIRRVKRPIIKDLELEEEFERRKNLPDPEESAPILADAMATTPLQRVSGTDPEEVRARKKEAGRNGAGAASEPSVPAD
jgi:hypothetical protein